MYHTTTLCRYVLTNDTTTHTHAQTSASLTWFSWHNVVVHYRITHCVLFIISLQITFNKSTIFQRSFIKETFTCSHSQANLYHSCQQLVQVTFISRKHKPLLIYTEPHSEIWNTVAEGKLWSPASGYMVTISPASWLLGAPVILAYLFIVWQLSCSFFCCLKTLTSANIKIRNCKSFPEFTKTKQNGLIGPMWYRKNNTKRSCCLCGVHPEPCANYETGWHNKNVSSYRNLTVKNH